MNYFYFPGLGQWLARSPWVAITQGLDPVMACEIEVMDGRRPSSSLNLLSANLLRKKHTIFLETS